jgi:hypothetical protein
LFVAGEEHLQGQRRTNFDKPFYRASIRGFSKPVSISFPDYSKAEELSDKIIDSRTTLYWNPYLRTDESGVCSFSFFAGDLPTTYKIVVEGVMAGGKPVSAVYTVVVK